LNPLPTIVFRAELNTPPGPTAGSEARPPAPSGLAAELFCRAQAGCPEAFASLVDEYGPRILRYLRHWTGNEQDAEDLTQETFLKAYRRLGQCSHARSLGGWLFTIARRSALNFHRARRSRPSNCMELHPDLPEPARANAGADADDRIWEAARTLASEYFEVLWLRYAEDLSVAEIGRALALSALNVRVRLHRARRQLRRQLEAGKGREPDLPGSMNERNSTRL
jgi:RNA polymerase sigma-70 factor, ECF subfamily